MTGSTEPPVEDLGDEHKQRLRIARHLLLSSPPGQFDPILNDLRNIFASSSSTVLAPDFVASVRSEYDDRTCRSILQQQGKGGEGEGDDATAKALRVALDKYVQSQYSSKGVVSSCQVVRSSASGETNAAGGGDCGGELLSVATYAERVDLRNCHAGSWAGRWTVDCSSAPSSASLRGTVSIRAHTFENNGNVQLRSTMEFGPVELPSLPSLSASSAVAAEKWADAVVNQIGEWEERDVQGSLRSMYDKMGDGMLKSLRRVMPVTRTKMEWNVLAHRMARTLGESSKRQQEENGER